MHSEKDGVSLRALEYIAPFTQLTSLKFPITALREIKILKMLSHVNILRLEEMAIERARGSLTA